MNTYTYSFIIPSIEDGGGQMVGRRRFQRRSPLLESIIIQLVNPPNKIPVTAAYNYSCLYFYSSSKQIYIIRRSLSRQVWPLLLWDIPTNNDVITRRQCAYSSQSSLIIIIIIIIIIIKIDIMKYLENSKYLYIIYASQSQTSIFPKMVVPIVAAVYYAS